MKLVPVDENTLRIDLDPDTYPAAVCWCYRTPDGTRYASSAQANALLMDYYREEDGVLGDFQTWNDGSVKDPTQPNLLMALRRLFHAALNSQAEYVNQKI